jgi:chromosome segregation ATPase
MPESGLQNIKGSEIKNTNLLAKDFTLAQKDLSFVLKDIESANKVLAEVKGEILRAKEELTKIATFRQPLIDVLDKKQEELCSENAQLDLENKAWFKQLSTAKEKFSLEMDNEEKIIGLIKQKQKSLEEEIAQQQKQSAILNGQDLSGAHRVKELTNQIKLLESKIANLKILELHKSNLKAEISALKEEKKSWLAQEKQLVKFRDSLDKREKDLNKAYSEVVLMHQRLKPKYIKTFKQYANI